MTALALDVLLEAGDLPARPLLRSGAEIIAQRVRAVSLLHYGEWPLDRSIGIRWLDYLGTKPFDVEGLAADLAVAWQAVDGVEEVTDISWDLDTPGQASITAELRLSTGDTISPTVQTLLAEGNVSITIGGVLGHSRTVAL